AGAPGRSWSTAGRCWRWSGRRARWTRRGCCCRAGAGGRGCRWWRRRGCRRGGNPAGRGATGAWPRLGRRWGGCGRGWGGPGGLGMAEGTVEVEEGEVTIRAAKYRLLWGRPPGYEKAGEASAAEKVLRLPAEAALQGKECDLRPAAGAKERAWAP